MNGVKSTCCQCSLSNNRIQRSLVTQLSLQPTDYKHPQPSLLELYTASDRLEEKSISGADETPVQLLELLVVFFPTPLLFLSDHSIEIGLLPKQWKAYEITAFPLKSTPKDVNDLCPISLACVFASFLKGSLLTILFRILRKLLQ